MKFVSRENFRITNVDTSHFYSEIEIYDKNLFRYIEEFITLLERLLNFQELKNELGDIKRIETQLDELKSSNSKIKGFLDL